MGLVINNPAFAAGRTQAFDEGLHKGFYQVRLAYKEGC